MRKKLPKITFGKFKELIEDKVSAQNKKYIQDFIKTKSVLEENKIKIKYNVLRLAYLLNDDLKKTGQKFIRKKLNKKGRDSIHIAIGIINKSGFAKPTLFDIITDIKQFYRWLFDGEEDFENYPWSIRDLKRPKLKAFSTIDPAWIYAEERTFIIIKNCLNYRDKFFNALDLDGPFRKIEKIRLDWKNLQKDSFGYYLRFETAKDSGDTIMREIRIVKSLPYLLEWMKNYPGERKPSYPIFSRLDKSERMTKNSVDAMFKRLRKCKDINFKIMPKLGRYSFTTRARRGDNGRKLDDETLKKMLGHTQRSTMISHYTKLSTEDTRDAQLKYQGVKERKKSTTKEIEPIKCPRCNTQNEYDADTCSKCRHALTPIVLSESQELKTKMALMEDQFEKILKRLQKIK